jgi:hypothetical protein
MTSDIECEEYPDIHKKYPSGATPEEKKVIDHENQQSARLYRALRYILVHDFGFTNALPVKAADFPGEITPHERAEYLAIHGIMLADNFNDPTLGKDKATGGDINVQADDGQPLHIANRFADAAVAAVQEYTSRAELFDKIYGFLRDEGKYENGYSSRNNPTTTAV